MIGVRLVYLLLLPFVSVWTDTAERASLFPASLSNPNHHVRKRGRIISLDNLRHGIQEATTAASQCQSWNYCPRT